MANAQKNPRDVLTPRAIMVWAAGVLIYIVAIVNRTSFGVAGVEAIDNFHINAGQLAVFTSVQVGVYALSQIPVGMLVDRLGPKKVLVSGSLLMAAGQIILALTTSYGVAIAARVLIGAGDATAFISVLRILPAWIPLRHTPLFTQLTSALGQIGQFISAVPFLALLHAQGWRPSFLAVGIAGAIVACASAVAIQNAPSEIISDAAPKPRTRPHLSIPRIRRSSGEHKRAQRPSSVPPLQALKMVATHPVCWEGFFMHWMVLVQQVNFTLLWGLPLMTLGMGATPAQAGMVLVINTIVSVLAGPIQGIISARAGAQRDLVALVFSVLIAVMWAAFFVSPSAPSLGVMIVLNIAFALITPAANFGFDTVRERVNHRVLATGTGLSNMGGFTACMLASQGVGLLLDVHSSSADYTWSDFRFAWLAVFAVWAVGTVGFVIARSRAQRFQRHF